MCLIRYVSLILLLAACNPQPKPGNQIVSIELACTGINADGQALHIDSTLHFQYFGALKNSTATYYTGSVSPAFWDTLNAKLTRIDYKNIHPKSEGYIIDDTAFETIISWQGGHKRRVSGRWRNSTAPLESVLRWMADSLIKIPLQKSGEPFPFKTTFQAPPPKPKTDIVRFPPPHKKH